MAEPTYEELKARLAEWRSKARAAPAAWNFA